MYNQLRLHFRVRDIYRYKAQIKMMKLTREQNTLREYNKKCDIENKKQLIKNNKPYILLPNIFLL